MSVYFGTLVQHIKIFVRSMGFSLQLLNDKVFTIIVNKGIALQMVPYVYKDSKRNNSFVLRPKSIYSRGVQFLIMERNSIDLTMFTCKTVRGGGNRFRKIMAHRASI